MEINGYELSVARQEFPENHWHRGVHFRNEECIAYNCAVFDLTVQIGIDCDSVLGEIVFFRCVKCRKTHSIGDGETLDIFKLYDLVHSNK